MQIAALLSEAGNALRGGDRAKAKQLASQALRLDSKHVETWLFLAEVVEAAEQKRDCFQRVLAFDPTNAAAKQGLQLLDAPAAPPAPPPVASVELPKSAWFGNQAAASQPTSSTIATPPLPTSAPSTGIRPLAQASTLSLAELSNLPASMPAAPNYAQPIQAGYPQPNYSQPNQANVPVNNHHQVQSQSGQVVYPHIKPSYNATLLKSLVFTVIGLFMFCFAVNAFFDLTKEPPPTPKVSAQDRTTAFINETINFLINPDFYNRSKQKPLVEPFLNNYFVEEERLNDGRMGHGLLNKYNNSDGSNDLLEALPFIKETYVTPIQYQVVSQTNEKVTLKLLSGDAVIVYHNGKFRTSALTKSFDTFTWVNRDGIWYLAATTEP